MTSASLASMELSGLFATSPEALRRRLLGPWSVGLRQYLALRVGDTQLAAEAFRELRRLVALVPSSEVLREPGPKAHVYRMARRIAHEMRDRPRDGGSLVFRPPARSSDSYAEAIRRVRSALGPEEAELVELRHARELSPAEIACVLDEPLAQTERRLEAATARALALLGAHAPDAAASRGGPLLDVFALARVHDRSTTVETHPPLPAGMLVGSRYRIVERVGVGAFGDVYRAEDADVPGHRVALKMLREPSLSQAAREAALRELKLIAACFHPSIVQFKDHGWHEDRLWFVMPWYDGETLEQRMRRGKLTRIEARRIFEPLARALATLHANGIRHQDIKPDNVLLARIKGLGDDGAELPVLLDLGVAAKDSEALVGGTPVYFAPEVAAHYADIEDDRLIGPKADVFALALSLRNALEPDTEEDVPAGAIEAFIERRARQRPAPPLARELRWLAPSFERWLSLDPEARPSAEDLAREIAVLTRPEERRARRRATAQWLVPMLLGLGALFGAVVYVFQQETELQERRISEARMEAAAAHADLLVEAARLEALDTDHAQLQARYEESALTRQQLADQLATSEEQVGILGQRIAELLASEEALQGSLGETREQLSGAQESAAGVRRQLDVETQRARDLGRYVDELRADSERITAELETELDAARHRIETLEEQVDQARSARREALGRVDDLEAELREAREARDRAEGDLDEVRRRMSQLRQMLEAPAPRSDAPVAGLETP